MYLVTIGWLFVVVLMALAEATHPNGTVLGACFTFLLYGALPLWIVRYLMGTRGRRLARRAAEVHEAALSGGASAGDPGSRGHAARDTVAPERIEP